MTTERSCKAFQVPAIWVPSLLAAAQLAGEIWLYENWARLAVYKLHCRGVVPKASFLRRPVRFGKPGDLKVLYGPLKF
jgi:hypothetical protein